MSQNVIFLLIKYLNICFINLMMKLKLLKEKKELFADVADIFLEYIHSLDQDEIFKLNEDINFNGWGAKHISEIENAYKL